MGMKSNQMSIETDVAIIGAGPSGLGAAIQLRKANVGEVLIIDRESEAGGIPRHCGHPPFGVREFYRVLSGPNYARKLTNRALDFGAKLLLNHSVTRLMPCAQFEVATNNGLKIVKAKRVLIATGVRETPRSARLVSGSRPTGITTTGALQSMVYLKNLMPFKKPLVVGTELVSFSAIMTCYKKGIRPVGMIEPGDRIVARKPFQLLAKTLSVPIFYNSQVEEIIGDKKVEGVRIRNKVTKESVVVDCDGVVFSGQFTPESSLGRMSHLEIDYRSGAYVVDQFGRCSDATYYAAGNVLHPVETAGWSFREGSLIGELIANDIKDLDCRVDGPKIEIDGAFKWVLPQKLSTSNYNGLKWIQLRAKNALQGTINIEIDGILWKRKRVSTLPERRILIPISELGEFSKKKVIKLSFS